MEFRAREITSSKKIVQLSVFIVGMVSDESGILRNDSTPKFSISIKKILIDISNAPRSVEIRYPTNEIRLRGTMINSTRGTRIKFAGIETRGKIPKELATIGNVISEAATVVFIRL